MLLADNFPGSLVSLHTMHAEALPLLQTVITRIFLQQTDLEDESVSPARAKGGLAYGLEDKRESLFRQTAATLTVE